MKQKITFAVQGLLVGAILLGFLNRDRLLDMATRPPLRLGTSR